MVCAAAAAAGLSGQDLQYLSEAAELSTASAGLTGPHPNHGCILVAPDGRRLASAYLRASGAVPPEVQAVQSAQGSTQGSTAYLNLESGDCHGEDAAVRSLVQAGVSRVVVGLKHPLPHARGHAIEALRRVGVAVDVLGEAPTLAAEEEAAAVRQRVLEVNEALLHRAARRRPLSILKYAMTLDGKIATQQGHSAWVTSPPARALVFEARARSDAVIVGGNTVRRDNPRLTTRKDSGHMPVRVVMSRTLDLPEDAALWDVSVAPTIVATQRGARMSFQAKLRAKGVEVVEFDFLTPEAVADYCYSRGFLQCFWECGGTLAAPCIASSVVHKLLAFVAPKVIGGARAPTPVGELGFVEMTQAVSLCDYTWQQVGPDLMLTGYLPASGGLEALAQELEAATSELSPDAINAAACSTSSSATAAAGAAATPAASAASAQAASSLGGSAPSTSAQATSATLAQASQQQQQQQQQHGGTVASTTSAQGRSSNAGSAAVGQAASRATATSTTTSTATLTQPSPLSAAAAVSAAAAAAASTSASARTVVAFYKAWDKWGALSNFSPHPVELPHFNSALQPSEPLCAALVMGVGAGGGAVGAAAEVPAPPQAESPAQLQRQPRVWQTVEHFYQAQKFAGNAHPDAAELVEQIAAAESPEEAARLGRAAERSRPSLLTPGWPRIKVDVMLSALRAKFAAHPGPRSMLLATCMAPGPAARLVEASPNDFFWGAGYNGNGRNVLGVLLAFVRNELRSAN